MVRANFAMISSRFLKDSGLVQQEMYHANFGLTWIWLVTAPQPNKKGYEPITGFDGWTLDQTGIFNISTQGNITTLSPPQYLSFFLKLGALLY